MGKHGYTGYIGVYIQYCTNILGSLYGDCHELLARARAKSSKFYSSSMIYKRIKDNDAGEFLERLVLHATREVSVYLYNFVQGLFYLCSP